MAARRYFGLFVALLLFLHECECIQRSDLFPFGPPAGDQSLPAATEDVSSKEVRLEVEVKFFGREYGSLFVNENGLLSFLTEIPSFFNVQFPLDYPLIAALYSDVDRRGSGQVFYRQSREPGLLLNLEQKVKDNFGRDIRFRPKEAFVATWDKVGYYEEKDDKVNTFQIVLVSDDHSTYCLLLYPENGIQWTRAKGKSPNTPDARAQAGIISGEGQHHALRGSGTDQITGLESWSNCNEAGVWIFKLGALMPGENIKEPNVALEPRYDPTTAPSCSSGGSSSCHSHARCLDHGPAGFCCQCDTQNGFYGDGRTCLEAGQPQRVNGRVSGQLNGVRIDEQDLHCYVVAEDGRTYTAVSKVGRAVGTEIQGLTALGSPVAWLFARSVDGAPNGFALTGGRMNYTAVVKYPDTGHEASVRLQFSGLDAFDYLKATGTISGTLPPLGTAGSEIEVNDYTEEFTRVRPGLITARSSRSFEVKGTGKTVNFEVEHTIEYEDCLARPEDPSKRTTRFKSARNYINYDNAEEVVRFAMTSQSVSLGADEDPCRQISCGSHSYCRADGDAAACVCNPGFEAGPNPRAPCVDVDECSMGSHDCHPEAECINQQGSYGCVCGAGFVGNGMECTEEQTCASVRCHANADCSLDRYGQPQCTCMSGYEGDGHAHCRHAPSRLTLSAYSQPLELRFDNSRQPEEVGPAFTHTYQVANLGPSTMGNIRLNVTWPLRDANGKILTVITAVPQIEYSGPTGAYMDPCEIDDRFVMSMPSEVEEGGRRRRKKRQSEDDDRTETPDLYEIEGEEDAAYIYDETLTTEAKYDDYESLTEYEKQLLSQYGDMSQYAQYGDDGEGSDDYVAEGGEEYDYSAFEVYNSGAAGAKMDVSPAPGTAGTAGAASGTAGAAAGTAGAAAGTAGAAAGTAGAAAGTADAAAGTAGTEEHPGREPVAERVVEEPQRAINTFAAREQEGAGQVTFTCRVILATGETAAVRVPARLNVRHLMQHYDQVGQFEIPSQARLGEYRSQRQSDGDMEGEKEYAQEFQVVGSDVVGAVTRVTPEFVVQAPGENVRCGGTECHRYAECFRSFDGQDRNGCRCLPGFRGDGRQCEMLNPEEGEDCRRSRDCHEQASCRYDEGRQFFQCSCNQGYRGDGFRCEAEEVNESTGQAQADTSCRERNDCNYNADCLELYRDQFVCQCRQGYDGDGYTCTPTEAPTYEDCRTENRCSPYADCTESRSQYEAGRYECRCRHGYRGDGYRCERLDGGVSEGGVSEGGVAETEVRPVCVYDSCTCPAGYDYAEEEGRCVVGRPVTVEPVTERQPEPEEDLCSNDDECDPNATCRLDENRQIKMCTCNEFYEGNGYTCLPGQDAGCDIRQDCDKLNGECVSHDDLDDADADADSNAASASKSGFFCRCKDGYRGDGYFCKKDVIGCNVINHCSKHAECLFDYDEGGYRCKCNERRGFEGDGFVCTPQYPCNMNPSVCDRYAECKVEDVPMENPRGPSMSKAECQCREGYLGDGYSCQAIPQQENNYILMSHGMALMNISFDENAPKGRPVVIQPGQTATGIALDCLFNQVFWTDTTGKSIMRSNYDGRQKSSFIRRDTGFPEGLAVDWASRNVYWTDSGKKTVEVASIDTGRRRVLFDERLDNPRGIAVHPTVGRLFWTDWSKSRPRIESSFLDGSERFVLVEGDLAMPNSITVDLGRYEVCWADGGDNAQEDIMPKIECADISGGNRRTIVQLEKDSRPYGIALTQNNVYWTDWNRPKVHGANRETGEILRSLPHVLEGMGKPFDLVSVPRECPAATTPCQSQELGGGGARCRHASQICLPDGRGGHACLCGKKIARRRHNEDDGCQDS